MSDHGLHPWSRQCRNCSVPVRWGALCWECTRMFVTGVFGALGAALVARWLA